MTTTAAIAQQFNVSEASVQSFLDFFRAAMEKSPELRQIAETGSDAEKEAAMMAGIKAWHERGQAFYQELLDNVTPRAQAWREEIRKSVIAAARAQKNQK